MKYPKDPEEERHLVHWEDPPTPSTYRRLPKPPPKKPELGKPMKNFTNKAHSATVRRRMMKWGLAGDKRYAGKSEDDPTWNPQTQGNKRYKVGSPAYKNLEKWGEARIQETPHGKGHKLGARLPSAAITRRLERQKKKEKVG